MPLYRYARSGLEPLRRTTFVAEQIRERQDIQRLLFQQIEVIDDDLLVVAEEYGLFQDSRRRIDLLALDRQGNLVVIELKRTDDGGHMELQALRYAAMVSTMTFDHLVDTFASAQMLTADVARDRLTSWLEEPIEELANHVRIVLVAGDFSQEITSTVLWLTENYSLDISCVRLLAYRLDDEVLLDVQQIIPLPEAGDFQIQQRQKATATTAGRGEGRDFTKYDLQIAGETFRGQSKQMTIKLAIERLHRSGVSVSQLRGALLGTRWTLVEPLPGESVEAAFQRENPNVSPKGRWYDLAISEGERYWVTPRFGGVRTEQMLEDLAAIAPDDAPMHWERSAAGGMVQDALGE